MANNTYSRRDFFKAGTFGIGGASLLLSAGVRANEATTVDYSSVTIRKSELNLPSRYALNLNPAKWIWYPSKRTLPNTFILFRKTLNIEKSIKSAKGWILGDSRYLLSLNGQRIQWGPPPADPRFSESDPMDLTSQLKSGENVIGATVLFYGYGDGSWPVGKPGFIFYLKINYQNGEEQLVVSDKSWKCHVARSWKPGQYKRWYLRSLQEEFDARQYPYGWNSPGFKGEGSWVNSMELLGSAEKPALSTNSSDYMYDSSSNQAVTELRKRTIPMITEADLLDINLEEAYQLSWKSSPQEYFEMIVPDAFEVEDILNIKDSELWEYLVEEENGLVLTFKVKEQMVGWPFFVINAPEGTVVELMVQEAHQLYRDRGPAMMNNHFNSWTRFICKEGENYFETFDFESIKWIQLHIHGASGNVSISRLGIRRRMYDWPNTPIVRTSDKNLQKILDACINTIYNNSQDTIVDGMGRERQQYSGDIGHVLHVLYRTFGEQRLPARYLNTYSQGLTKNGFFLDCWPAYDRLNRLAQRQLDLTKWGPLLDHGVGFNFDCYHHYLYTGNLQDLEEVWPRLVIFFNYLKSIKGQDGLLPVEDLGIPAVWIDHDAYQLQRHKQCAFNLYTLAMLNNAFSPLAKAMGEDELSKEAESFGQDLFRSTVSKYWDAAKGVYLCNKPWISEEVEERMCDRSLATAVLFDLVPGQKIDKIMEVLVNKPKNLGMSYPPNTNWYLWALGKAGKIGAIFKDFNDRWLKLESIHQNNTMQESWHAEPDSSSQWSHASIAPLITVFSDLAGIKPIKPGYQQFQIQPNPGKLEMLELYNYTPHGPIEFSISGKSGKRNLELKIPKGINGELVLDEKEKIELKIVRQSAGKKIYALHGGSQIQLRLKHL